MYLEKVSADIPRHRNFVIISTLLSLQAVVSRIAPPAEVLFDETLR